MRFFSNDKDARDEQQGVDVRERADEVNPEQAHDDVPDHVQSDPVPVPQQRAGSPWSSADAPGATTEPVGAHAVDPDQLDDQSRLDDQDRVDDQNRVDDQDRLETSERADGAPAGGPAPFHEPGPQPTAFGAGTVGGAVAASATANPENDRWDARTPVTDAGSGVADDRSVAPGDGAVDDRVEAPGDGAVDGDRPGPVAEDRRPDETVSDETISDGTVSDENEVDVALEDRGTFEDPQVRDEVGREDTTPPDHAVADTSPDAVAAAYAESSDSGDAGGSVTGPDAALRDEGGFDDPKAVDPATEQPLAAAGVGAAAAAGAGVAGAAAAGDRTAGGESKPGSISAPGLAKLFGDDAGSFRDRWREVQLRFVDSPKEATSEAAGLVDEVVDQLSANLKKQRAALAGEGSSDDTEKLRVELRSYRDFLNRLLDL